MERASPAAVYADPSRTRNGVVVFNPWCMREGDAERVAAVVKPLLRY